MRTYHVPSSLGPSALLELAEAGFEAGPNSPRMAIHAPICRGARPRGQRSLSKSSTAIRRGRAGFHERPPASSAATSPGLRSSRASLQRFLRFCNQQQPHTAYRLGAARLRSSLAEPTDERENELVKSLTE
jgi:hypothetical protein